MRSTSAPLDVFTKRLYVGLLGENTKQGGNTGETYTAFEDRHHEKLNQPEMKNKYDITEWHYAYFEQLYLYYKHDGYWIECAKIKWPKGEAMEEFDRFLTSYGLKRGQIGKFLNKNERERQNTFFNTCHNYFKQEWVSIENAKNLWKEVVEQTLVPRSTAEDPVNPWSATSKVFWLHHPEKLPMYDTQVANALRIELDRKITPDNFLESFVEYYDTMKAEVERVHQFFNKRYISLPRVVDKYLWLRGLSPKASPKENELFTRFKHAFQQSPFLIYQQ